MKIKVFFYKNKVIVHNIYSDYNNIDIFIQKFNLTTYHNLNTGLHIGSSYQLCYGIGYMKHFFHLIDQSYYKICKYFLNKNKIFRINIIRTFNLIYSYFIYNKYCIYLYSEKAYHINLYSIYNKKVFNCRDLYKIVAICIK